MQLFYLKEKKKKTPNHTKNKTNNEKEFRVALLALCAVWSSPRSARRGDQRRARPPGSRPDSGTDSRHQLSTTGLLRPSCCGPWAQACLWALPAPGSSGNQLFPREPGRPLLGGLQLCGRGVLGFCPFPLSSRSPCLASSPRPRLAPPVVVAVRFLRSLLSVCKHSCVMSVGQALGAEKWNRLSRQSVEPLLCQRAPAGRSSVTPHGVALPRGAPGDGSVAPSPREAGPAGQTGLGPPLGGVSASGPSESLVGRWSVSG